MRDDLECDGLVELLVQHLTKGMVIIGAGQGSISNRRKLAEVTNDDYVHAPNHSSFALVVACSRRWIQANFFRPAMDFSSMIR
jgi:hypothetical protein